MGVHVAASAERPQSVPSSMTSSFLHKVVLRQSDEEWAAGWYAERRRRLSV